MPRYNVVGILHRSGQYEGRDYDNYNIQCTYERTDLNNLSGLLVDTIKIPASIYRNDIALGNVLVPSYDRYGRLQSYEVF